MFFLNVSEQNQANDPCAIELSIGEPGLYLSFDLTLLNTTGRKK